MAGDRGSSRDKTSLPHSRSISLRMLTHRPGNVPLEEKMYSESLQPLRSPPGYASTTTTTSPFAYSTDSLALAPALAPFSVDDILGASRVSSSSDTGSAAPRYHATPSPPDEHDNDHDINDRKPAAGTVTPVADAFVKRGAYAGVDRLQHRSMRAVSMPPMPSSTTSSTPSPYDDMFAFSSALPDNFSRTVGLSPAATAATLLGNPTRPMSPPYRPSYGSTSSSGGGGVTVTTQTTTSSATPYASLYDNHNAADTRATYIQNGRAVSNPTPQYTTQHQHQQQQSQYRQTGTSSSGRSAPLGGGGGGRGGESHGGGGRPVQRQRRPSVLHSLSSWLLERRQDGRQDTN